MPPSLLLTRESVAAGCTSLTFAYQSPSLACLAHPHRLVACAPPCTPCTAVPPAPTASSPNRHAGLCHSKVYMLPPHTHILQPPLAVSMLRALPCTPPPPFSGRSRFCAGLRRRWLHLPTPLTVARCIHFIHTLTPPCTQTLLPLAPLHPLPVQDFGGAGYTCRPPHTCLFLHAHSHITMDPLHPPTPPCTDLMCMTSLHMLSRPILSPHPPTRMDTPHHLPARPLSLLQDFAAAGYSWTPALCRDSDGDGHTNGHMPALPPPILPPRIFPHTQAHYLAPPPPPATSGPCAALRCCWLQLDSVAVSIQAHTTPPCNPPDPWPLHAPLLVQDFAAAGYSWTPALCHKDSDGDGHSNGQELGDPHCKVCAGPTQKYWMFRGQGCYWWGWGGGLPLCVWNEGCLLYTSRRG